MRPVLLSIVVLLSWSPALAQDPEIERAPIWRSVLEWICENDPERRHPMFLSTEILTRSPGGGFLTDRHVAERLADEELGALARGTCLAPFDLDRAVSLPIRSTVHLTPPRQDAERGTLVVQVFLRGIHPSDRSGEGIWSWSKSTFYHLRREPGGWAVVDVDLDVVTN